MYHPLPQPNPKPHTLAHQIYQTQTPQSFYTPNLYPNFIYSCTNVTACTLTHFFSTNFSPLVIFNRHMQGERGGSVSSIFWTKVLHWFYMHTQKTHIYLHTVYIFLLTNWLPMTMITDTVKKRQSGQQRFLQKSFILLLALAVVIIAVLAGVIVWQYFQKSATDQVRAPFNENIL